MPSEIRFDSVFSFALVRKMDEEDLGAWAETVVSNALWGKLNDNQWHRSNDVVLQDNTAIQVKGMNQRGHRRVRPKDGKAAKYPIETHGIGASQLRTYRKDGVRVFVVEISPSNQDVPLEERVRGGEVWEILPNVEPDHVAPLRGKEVAFFNIADLHKVGEIDWRR